MTHSLDARLAIVSGSNLLIYRKVTYSLDACSPILVSSSNLLNSWGVTHILDVFQFTSLVNGKPHVTFYNLTNSPFQRTSYYVSLNFPMNATYILPIFHKH